jgi:ABC-type lipoprotein release transport system permease subunit
MNEVPVKLPFQEVLLICMFAIVSSVVAAFIASRKISKIKPSEVLRYE